MKKIAIIAAMIALIFVVQSISLASAVTISGVTSTPDEVEPGEKVTLNIEVENTLEDDIEKVIVSLDLKDVPFSPYQSSSEKSIDEIDEGDEEKISFKLIADPESASGIYKIPVTISYIIKGETEREDPIEGLVSLIIKASPELQIGIEDSVLLKGQNNELSVRITNSGLGDARLLSIRINPVSGINVLGQNSVYIGDIDSDDFDTADFSVFIKESAPNNINLPVEIGYRNSQNELVTENKIVILRSYSLQEAIQLGLIQTSKAGIYIGVIVAVIVLFIIYRIIRGRIRARRRENARR